MEFDGSPTVHSPGVSVGKAAPTPVAASPAKVRLRGRLLVIRQALAATAGTVLNKDGLQGSPCYTGIAASRCLLKEKA